MSFPNYLFHRTSKAPAKVPSLEKPSTVGIVQLLVLSYVAIEPTQRCKGTRRRKSAVDRVETTKKDWK